MRGGGPRAGARHGGGGSSRVETAAEIGGGGRSRGKFAGAGGPGARACAWGRRAQGLERVPAEPGRGAEAAGGGTLAPFSRAGPPPPARTRPPQPAPARRASPGPVRPAAGGAPSLSRGLRRPLLHPSVPSPRRPRPPVPGAPCRAPPDGPTPRALPSRGWPSLLRQCPLRPRIRPEGDRRVGGGGPACGEASLGLRPGAGEPPGVSPVPSGSSRSPDSNAWGMLGAAEIFTALLCGPGHRGFPLGV